MPLNSATAASAVDTWAASLATPWTGVEKTGVADRMVALAAILEPHLVEDVPMAADRRQAYWLGRTIGHVEDWLIRSALGTRRALRVGSARLRLGAEEHAVGLRSATHEEVEALPGVGDVLAEQVRRYLATHPDATEMDALLQVSGIGPDRLEQLESTSYLDAPNVVWASPTQWAFTVEPNVPNALALLESSDATLVFADGGSVGRRLPAPGASVYERFSAFLDLVIERARLSVSGAAGSLASEAIRWLERRETRERVLSARVDATGTVLSNGDYVASARAAIDAATTTVELMVFLGTLTDADDGLAPLPLIESLEAAAARGVAVRAILDQDDGGEPYGSAIINDPLVARFQAGSVAVKLDTKDTLLHSKVLVVDRATCIVGSHNWTRSGFTKTHELSVRLESGAVAASFGDRFDALWTSLPDLS